MKNPTVVVAGVHFAESTLLCACPVVCAVADAWVGMQHAGKMAARPSPRDAVSPNLLDTLDALELTTRESQLRKVRP